MLYNFIISDINMFNEIKSRSENFYRVVQQLRVPNMNTHISNNSRIPNAIRNSDRELEIWISEIEPFATIKLTDLCQYRNKGKMYLHVLKNILHNNVQKIRLKEWTSHQITEMAFSIEFSVENTGSIIAIEWQKEYSRFVNPQVIKDNFQIENSQIELTVEIGKKKKSFVQKKLTRQEEDNVIIFLSSKYSGKDSNGTKSLLAITILKLDKEVLYNTLVTPRRRVVDFDTANHGITEIDSRGHVDEYKAISEVREILKGKIIVGYDVVDQLENLCLKIVQVLGIRELSTARAIEKPKNVEITKDSYIQFTDLLEMFKIKLTKNDIFTFSEAETVRNIYQQIGDKWKDHIYPNNCLEKESSHILEMTILKDDNRTDKQDRTNRWKTKNVAVQKRGILEIHNPYQAEKHQERKHQKIKNH